MSLLNPAYEAAECARNPRLWDTDNKHHALYAAGLCRDTCPVYDLCVVDTLVAEKGVAGKLHGVRAGMVATDRMRLRKRARA